MYSNQSLTFLNKSALNKFNFKKKKKMRHRAHSILKLEIELNIKYYYVSSKRYKMR